MCLRVERGEGRRAVRMGVDSLRFSGSNSMLLRKIQVVEAALRSMAGQLKSGQSGRPGLYKAAQSDLRCQQLTMTLAAAWLRRPCAQLATAAQAAPPNSESSPRRTRAKSTLRIFAAIMQGVKSTLPHLQYRCKPRDQLLLRETGLPPCNKQPWLLCHRYPEMLDDTTQRPPLLAAISALPFPFWARADSSAAPSWAF